MGEAVETTTIKHGGKIKNKREEIPNSPQHFLEKIKAWIFLSNYPETRSKELGRGERENREKG